MRALLVEDDDLLAAGIQRALIREGLHVDWLDNGKLALNALLTETFDIVILDLTLPGMDGIDVLTQARKANNKTPVLILTARDTIDERVKGLDCGADDYLIKPFELIELKARVRALTRRSKGNSNPVLSAGELSLDPSTQEVKYQNQLVALSRREYSLLLEFINHPEHVFSREVLETKLYGWNEGVNSNSLEVHISKLRKKIHPRLIKTIRGVGYKLVKL